MFLHLWNGCRETTAPIADDAPGLPLESVSKCSVWIPGKYEHLISPRQAQKWVTIILNITLKLCMRLLR